GAADTQILSSQHAVAAREMVASVVVQRTDQRELVCHAGLLGEQLADVHTGHAGVDGLPDPTVLGRGFGLQVIQVHEARTAGKPEEDHGGVLAGAGAARRRGPRPQYPGQPDTGHAGHAELEKTAAGKAVAIPTRWPCVDAHHWLPPCGAGVDVLRL